MTAESEGIISPRRVLSDMGRKAQTTHSGGENTDRNKRVKSVVAAAAAERINYICRVKAVI